MRVIVCRKFGPPEQLVLEERASPTPAPGQVVVAVRAAGVNFTDVLATQGRSQLKIQPPFTPGVEVAGVVSRVGAGVTRLREGMRVLATGFHGGYAEEIAFADLEVAVIPDAMDFEAAAAFYIASNTALYALRRRAQLQRGETLLVLGAGGGTGLAAVEIGKLLGATVIAAASTDAKLDVCRKHGADALINYDREDLKERVRALTNGRGADVVYDPVGGSYTAAASRSVAWNGRYLVIGFAAGEIPQIPLNLPLLKGYSIVGVYWGGFVQREPAGNAANMKQLMDWIAAGKLVPLISARYPLSQAVDALFAMMRREVTGKIVIVP